MISTLKNLHLDLSVVAPVFLAGMLAVIVFTLFIYRRTNPIIPKLLKSMLVSLRIGALLLLLFVLFQATLSLFFETKNPPILAIAVDTSASMTIHDRAGSRAALVDSILQDKTFAQLQNKFDTKYFTFANSIDPVEHIKNDSLQFIGDATNIQKAIETIQADNAAENLSGILIISDGAYNAGGNPVRAAEALGLPVHAIAVGSDEPLTDLAITNVEANPFAYAGQPTPIKLTVHNSGFSSRKIQATLRSGGVAPAEKTVTIPPSPSDTELTINYTPEKIGRQKLVLSVPGQTDEQTLENNQHTIYIDVFKSKLKILLIAGALSPDISFLKRLLTTDRYEISTLIQKQPGRFYEGNPNAELENADMLILYDFPTAGSSRQFTDALLNVLQQKKLPLLFIAGKNASWPELSRFADFIPIKSAAQTRREQLVTIQLSPLGDTHPIMQVSSDPTLARSLWGELPPVFSSFVAQQVAPGTQVLSYSRAGLRSAKLSPMIMIRSNGAHKSAAILAHELWRWDLMMWGINRSEDVYRNMLINMAKWLETNRSDSLVRVEMDGANYKYGDPIAMRIEVYDENLTPVSNSDVAIQLQRSGWRREYSAKAMGEGKYSMQLQPPQPGDYEATVIAKQGDRTIGSRDVLFSVGEYSAELSDLQAQPAVLHNLAQATGGVFTTPDSLNRLLKDIHGVATISKITREHELWNNKVVLALILLLLTTEWFIRKRKGML